MSKLIADSGSTKTDWILIENGKQTKKLQTLGLNPYFQTTDKIVTILQNELKPALEAKILSDIFFYGAGCTFVENQKILAHAFEKIFGCNTRIHITSDLVAAALALCGNSEGIACILGTGSNSCHWDGEKIIKNVPPLGYILGDEGSGAVIGKLFIADLLKGRLTKALTEKFFTQYGTNPPQLINQIYSEPLPNRTLASYCQFLLENKEDSQIREIIKQSFHSFVMRNLLEYPAHLKVHFIGSVAVFFEEILKETLLEYNLKIGKILKRPIENLTAYHLKL